LHPCYLKLRPFGWASRLIARIAAPLKIIRCVGFSRHIFDHGGQELSSWRLLWLCCSNITMDVVLTVLDWGAAA
jgi:hypothetical protein